MPAIMIADSPCVCTTLRRITRAVTASYDEALRPSGLRITQFAILRALIRVGPVTVTGLAAEVAIDRSTMGRNLAPLERRGLVRLDIGEKDQRERVVRLTEAGISAVEAAIPFWSEAQERLAADLQAEAVIGLASRLGAARSP